MVWIQCVYFFHSYNLFTWDVIVNTTSNCTVFLPTRKALNTITTVDQWTSCTIDNSIECTKWAETNIHESSNSSFTILINCSSTSQLSVHHTTTTKTSLTWNVLKSSQTYISRPGIINYPHTYMPSEHFPGGVDSMCIFLSFMIFLLGMSTVIQCPIVPSSYQQEKGYLFD